jgi:hypothetical protein
MLAANLKPSPALKLRIYLIIFALGIGQLTAQPAGALIDSRGRQFIGLDSLSGFVRTLGSHSGEWVFTSADIRARINFNELIVSWNAEMPPGSSLVIEARALYPQTTTKYYTLAVWSVDPARHRRHSVSNQTDKDGDVSTDTLILLLPTDRLQIRLTFAGDKLPHPPLKFLGISLADTSAPCPRLPPNLEAWGKVLPVPERTQMIYPNGKTLCSPTTVSMLMAFWAEALKRPGLDHSVPEIADAIYDSQWQGTGNWPFNMAYAGSFESMRAYVARFSDVSELEDWIAQGIPVGMSVDYDRLRAKGPGPNGHLVACVGFTKDGDPIINDPGTSQHVRKTFPRKNLIDAWAVSRNTVYLVYPQEYSTPVDRFGHWDSSTTRQSSSPGN